MYRLEAFLYSLYFWLLLLVSITLPYKASINSIFLIFATVMAIILTVLRKGVIGTKYILLCFSYLFIICIGLVNTENIEYGLFFVEKNLGWLALPIACSSLSYLNKKKIEWLLVSFAISAVVASFICLGYGLLNVNENPRIFKYSYFTDVIAIHPAYFSLYLVFSFCIIGFFYYNKWLNLKLGYRIICFGSLLYLFLFIIFLKARMPLGIFIVVLTTITILLYIYKPKLRLTIFFTILALSCSAFFFIHKNIYIKYRLFSSVKYGFEMRLQSWQASLNIIRDTTYFGVGTGDVHDALNDRYQKLGFLEPFKYNFNAHNQYLENFVRNGFLGFSILLLIFGYHFWFAIKNKNLLHLCLIMSLGIFCITESALNQQKGIIFFTFFGSIFMFNEQLGFVGKRRDVK